MRRECKAEQQTALKTLLKEKEEQIKAQLKKTLHAQLQHEILEKYGRREPMEPYDELKQQLTERIQRELAAEYHERIAAEVARLQQSATKEIEENTKRIRLEIEKKLSAHVAKLNRDVYRKYSSLPRLRRPLNGRRNRCALITRGIVRFVDVYRELKSEHRQQIHDRTADSLRREIEIELRTTLPKKLEAELRGQIELQIEAEARGK